MPNDQDEVQELNDHKFADLVAELNKLLSELRKEVTSGEGILDPNTQKKKELLARIKPLMKQLQHNWVILKEEEIAASKTVESSPTSEKQKKIVKAKEKLILVMQHLKLLVGAISGLAMPTESAYKAEVVAFNIEAAEFNDEIERLANEYQLLKANTDFIARFEYGKDLSTYMGYAAAVLKALYTIGLAWYDTFSKASQAAGAIFSPISAIFTSLTKLFSFLGRTGQLFIAKTDAERAEIDEVRKLELEDTRALLRKSAILTFLSFAFSVVSTLAVAGILATPIGWAFVAATSLVDWLDEGLGASQRADKALGKYKEINKIILADPEHVDYQKAQEKLAELQAKADNARIEARWGLANVVGMTLIACGPIPFAGPILGLVGLAIFSTVAARNAYKAVTPHIQKYLASKKAKVKQDNEPSREHGIKTELELGVTPTPKPEIEPSITRVSTLLSSSVASEEHQQPTSPLLSKRAVTADSNPDQTRTSTRRMFQPAGAKNDPTVTTPRAQASGPLKRTG